MKGIQASGRVHILFYKKMIFSACFLIQHPLPELSLIQLQNNSQISGHKINWNKSEVMPVSNVCHSVMVEGWIKSGT